MLIQGGGVYKNGKKDRAAVDPAQKIIQRGGAPLHGRVLESCQKSLEDLGLEYLDLYFIHWPFPNYHAPGCSGDSRNPDSKPFSIEEFMKTWRQCEELVDKGLVRYKSTSGPSGGHLPEVGGPERTDPDSFFC